MFDRRRFLQNLAALGVSQSLPAVAQTAAPRFAADQVIRSMEKGQELAGYSNLVHDTFNKEFRCARSFASIVYRIPRLASDLLSGSPTLQDYLFDTIRGGTNFSGLRTALLHHLPQVIGEALTNEGME